MKRLFYLILACLLVLSLGGCRGRGGNVEPDTTKAEDTTAEQTTEEPTTKAATDSPRGSWDSAGKTFTNELTDITFTIPDSFTPMTEGDLAKYYLDDPDFDFSKADFEKMTTIPDCGCVNYSTGENIGILYENLAAEGATSVSEDYYLDIALGNLESNITGTGDYYDLTLAGNNYRAYDMINETVYQTVAVRKVGDYMALIFFTSFEPDGNKAMIAFFN